MGDGEGVGLGRARQGIELALVREFSCLFFCSPPPIPPTPFPPPPGQKGGASFDLVLRGRNYGERLRLLLVLIDCRGRVPSAGRTSEAEWLGS